LQRKVSKHKTAKIKSHLALKPLLQTNPHRFVLFPIQHNDIWRVYKKAKASFWTTKDINLSADAMDLNRLSLTEQHFISHVLAFLQHLMASSTRISAAILQQKSRCLKLDVSTAFRLPSKTSTVRHTRSSSTHTSRTPPRRRISYGRLKPY
jgi:hypothetical protein